jgi:hypothetical protein
LALKSLEYKILNPVDMVVLKILTMPMKVVKEFRNYKEIVNLHLFPVTYKFVENILIINFNGQGHHMRFSDTVGRSRVYS